MTVQGRSSVCDGCSGVESVPAPTRNNLMCLHSVSWFVTVCPLRIAHKERSTEISLDFPNRHASLCAAPLYVLLFLLSSLCPLVRALWIRRLRAGRDEGDRGEESARGEESTREKQRGTKRLTAARVLPSLSVAEPITL